MINNEKVPVEIFVNQVMATKPALAITDQWPIKAEMVIQIVIRHLNDLGFYHVMPGGQDHVIRKEILFFLKNSSTIMELIDKAKKAAAAAAQRGRAQQDQ
jgi:hypothetical protein